MKNLYSVGKTAKLSGTTIATLHHYDKIGLLKPFKVDENTGYRYYSDNELVYLNVINFCKQRNMSLESIKKVFENDNFNYIVDFLDKKEKEIGIEINELERTRAQIYALKNRFMQQYTICNVKLSCSKFTIKKLDERAIVKVDSLQEASIENFNNMMSCLYNNIDKYLIDQFEFDNSVNVITSKDTSCLFVKCTKYPTNSEYVTLLPKGQYLYGYCSRNDLDKTLENILKYANENYNITPEYIIQSIVFTGMFSWFYEVQVLISLDNNS